MFSTRVLAVRTAPVVLCGLATAASLICVGCTVKDTVKTTDDLQAAPGMYGNALNRAHDVAGKVERKSAEGVPTTPTEKANGE